MTTRRFAPMMFVLCSLLMVFSLMALPVWAADEEEGESPLIHGPLELVMGDNLAHISLDHDHAFAGAEDTQAILQAMGNFPGGNEIGLVVGTREEENWFMIFEWEAVGYVPDDEKDELDADAILDSFRKGTEEANKVRRERGDEQLFVKGWHTPPYYDEASNNLRWVLIGEDEAGVESYNYNTRILGRKGYMSVVLVSSALDFETARQRAEAVIGTISYTDGKSYAEFRSGDKIAKYGLTALIAGGAGAAAAKFGLFKYLGKAGKFLILAGLAAFGAMAKLFKGIFGRGDKSA